MEIEVVGRKQGKAREGGFGRGRRPLSQLSKENKKTLKKKSDGKIFLTFGFSDSLSIPACFGSSTRRAPLVPPSIAASASQLTRRGHAPEQRRLLALVLVRKQRATNDNNPKTVLEKDDVVDSLPPPRPPLAGLDAAPVAGLPAPGRARWRRDPCGLLDRGRG